MAILKKRIGENDFHSGNWKGVDFGVFFIKDMNCNIIMMSIYSRLVVHDDQK